jgi:hypothetical protein
MAMHSLIYRIFTFFLSMLVSAGFVAVGLIIAFWPATYMRWLRWSNVDRYPRWLLPGSDLGQSQYGRQFRKLGIVFALFGAIATALNIWIYWFQ